MRPHPVHSKKVGRMINDKNSFEDLDADYMEVVEGIEGQRNTRKLADADFFNGKADEMACVVSVVGEREREKLTRCVFGFFAFSSGDCVCRLRGRFRRH